MWLFAWLGGALFVLALADCAFTYLVVWARVLPFGGAGTIAINVLLFGIFALHHSVFARESVKGVVGLVVPDRWLRSVYVWIASGLLIATLALWVPIGGEIYRAPGGAAAALAVVQIIGLSLIARSVAAIDPLELAGIRVPPAAGALSVSGPYRLVRHPLYLGWLLIVFGSPHMTGDRLAFAAITTAYLLVAIPWEERSLSIAFGAEYAQYSRSVRWRLVPYVY